MIDMKQLSGIMNTDDANSVMPATHHKMARNMRFRGNGNNMEGQGVPGTRLIVNNLPTGDNECIGSFYDSLRQRIIWFNYNSNLRHGIYQYDIEQETVTALLVCFTNSAGDILDFSLDYPIPSVVMLYTTEDDGDILQWTDRRNRPRKLNIKDAIDNTYGAVWIEDYLTINRQTPQLAPSCTYSDDATVTVNNLRSYLYQFRYRYWYRDNNKSTWSTYSKLFTPADPDDLATNIDPLKNNRIDITLNTGGADCIKIEIAFRQSETSTFSDCLLIPALDKAALSISDDSIYTYQFFNDVAYTPIDPLETGLLWSNVPQLANTIELLNGNVIIYGATTEGYDYDEEQDVEVTVTLIDNPDESALSILSYQVGRNWVFMFLGTPVAGDFVTLYITLDFANGDPSVNYNYSYLVLGGDDAEDVSLAFIALITGSPDLVTAAQRTDSNGTTGIIITGDNAFDVVHAEQDPEIIYINPDPAVNDISIAMFHHKSNYRAARVYFDEFDETNGVVTTDNLSIETPEVDTTSSTQMKIPQIHIEVNDQPPIWAKSFSWVFTNSLTYLQNTYTVTSATAQDGDYGYLNITNLQINQNKYPVYGYAKGDRVRIFGLYGGSINFVDVPVSDLVEDPTISGVNKTGSWLKVPYVATPMSTFGGNTNWAIEIYTPAPNVTPDLQGYFEIGERYLVLNPGESNRAHQGMIQDQIVGVGAQPAIYNFIRGDFYIRTRELPFTDNLTNINTVWIIDQSVSDLYPSKVKNNGREYVIDESTRNTFYMTRSRWSEKYQQNTNINQTNICYPLNIDEIDRAKGEIQRFLVEDRLLYVYQNRAVAQYGVYSRFIKNNNGDNELVTTTDIITANNINYLQGEYGVGDQFCSVIRGNQSRHYFADPVRGYLLRRSGDGLEPISELYWGQYHIRSLIVPYNKSWERANGSWAKILGCYDYVEEQYMPILQSGTIGTDSIEPHTFSFNEKRNGFCSFYDILNPDWMMSAEDKMYAWKNGRLYVHDNEENWCNFFGVQYYPSITLVFNDKVAVRKTFNALSLQSNQYWASPENGMVKTSEYNSQTGFQQISQLKEVDYELRGNYRDAALWRDANSMADAREALVNGAYLEGQWLEVEFKYYGSNFATLYVPYLNYQLNNRNF